MKRIGSVIACVMLSGCVTSSEGDRVGEIAKFSQKGLFCKTWEGELAMLGFKRGQQNSGNVFEFTVEDVEVVHAVKSALDNGYQVRLTYKQEMFSRPCRTEQSGRAYYVTAVTVLR